LNSLIYRTRGSCPAIPVCLSPRHRAARRLPLHLAPGRTLPSKAKSLSLFTFFMHSNRFLQTATAGVTKSCFQSYQDQGYLSSSCHSIARTKQGACLSLALKAGISIKPLTDGRSRCLACFNHSTCSAWKNWQVDSEHRIRCFDTSLSFEFYSCF